MPTLMASAPASISARAPSAVATLPAITWQALLRRLTASTASSTPLEWPWAVSTTITSTSASSSASARLHALGPDAGGRGDAQAALLVLAGVGEALGLFDVLDGDQADAAIGVVDHQQLLDAVLVQQALGLGALDAVLHRDQPVLGHQLAHRLALIAGEAHVAVGQDADQLAAAALDHRKAGDLVLLHQAEGVGQGLVGMDGERVHHHAGFEFLDLADFVGLLGAYRGSCG